MTYAPYKKLMLILTAFIMLAGQAWALDLPVKRIKGKQYYYHKVKKGESLYGVSKHLGISIDEILESNPEAANGIGKGDILVFPFERYTVLAKDSIDSEPTAEAAEDTIAEATPRRASIAILLPFGLHASEPTRTNALALDFYKGALIAADSLSKTPGHIEIISRDIDGLTPQAVRDMITSDTLLNTASVIIGPEDAAALTAIAETAPEGTYVLNVLNTRDSLYLSDSNILQANVPQRQMYRLAVDALMHDYDGYRPVILHNAAGRNDREAFTAYLKERYRRQGTEPIVIEYQTNLISADMEALPVAAGEKYVVIPSDGSVSEFNRFSHVLRSFRDRVRTQAEEDGSGAAIEVFGYPDWTAFRGEAQDMLHRLGSTVYSRFFDDFNGFSAKTIEENFRHWYGTSMITSIPTSGVLGFDTMNYLIKNIRQHQGVYSPKSVLPYSGIQSTFDFVRSGEGYVNNSIYIITYLAGGRLSARVQ